MLKRGRKANAFTMIELLVVILIIGTLFSLALLSLGNARRTARDAKRVADIKQIQFALEIYYRDNGEYPVDISSSIATGSTVYISTVPTAPTPADGDCTDEGNIYTYVQQSLGSSYTIDFCLGSQAGELIAGTKRATPEGIITPPPPQCGEYNVTFTYNGSSVTYGTVVGQNSTCWLDRNLGATQVAVSSTDSNAYGDLFQWGRLDDGHQIRTSGTTGTLATSDTPGHSNFILAPNSPYDWRSPQNTNLWQEVSGSNNPCPNGWRIPTETEWTAERLGWGSNDSAGAFTSSLKLTAAGNRGYVDGSIASVGAGGGYWASTINGTNSRYLSFSGAGSDMFNNGRAYGFTVRCVKN